MTPFRGFSDETFTFLRDLRANNSKDWFDANRDRYETHYKGVALDFVAQLAEPMAALALSHQAVPKLNKSLRRINRDVRFSKDKSPYNPRIHLIFWTGDHPNKSPAMHLVIHPDGIGYGAGVFGLEPAQLSAIRARIMNKSDRDALIKAIGALEQVGCAFDEPDLKNLPKGFEAQGDWEHLLRRKAFVMRTLSDIAPPDWIKTPAAIDEVMALTKAAMPFNAWFCATK